MEKELFFSIVIPAYNRAHMIKETLESTFLQTYPNYEIIVVDDGSTDNTEEVIKTFNHPKITYHKKKNEERAVARNTGTQLAKGDYVIFFDSDDYLLPNHLSEAVKLVKKHNNPEMMYLPYNIMDVDKNILKEIEKSEINFLSKESKEVHLKIQNSAKEYFLRKKVLSNMKIVDNTDEYFVVSTNVSFDDEILNIVKQWIPYIEILKPVELQEKLEDVLKKYLDKNIK